MIVLKLGGSVITQKDTPETLAEASLDRVTAAIAAHDGDLVVVHGGGSFGHPIAARHGLSRSTGTHDGDAVREVHGAMRRLNDAVVDHLLTRGCRPVPVHPLSVGHRSDDGDLHLPTGQVETCLEEGFLPVLHGDVVAHVGRGVTVVSGDELLVALARALPVDRVGLCSAVPGVLDEEGSVIEEIAAFEEVASVLGESETTDVTGGMAAKVRTLLTVDVPASIFDVDALPRFLEGAAAGTTVTSA